MDSLNMQNTFYKCILHQAFNDNDIALQYNSKYIAIIKDQ